MFEIEWRGTPNFTRGRGGRMPVAIVNHITAGAFPGCLNWMLNPVAEASAHYLVTRAGRIIQIVKDEDASWHAGEVNQPNWMLYDGANPNRYTIGIEHEGYYTYWDEAKTQIKDSLGGDGELTEEQYQATLWLHRQLVERWGIPVDEDHIIGHYRIDSVNRPNCPGPNFPWERLFNDLQGGVEMGSPEPWKLEIIEKAKAAGLISSDHNPDEPASKWFVLAVMLNMLKVVRGE